MKLRPTFGFLLLLALFSTALVWQNYRKEAGFYGPDRVGWYGGLRWGTSEANHLFNFAESVFPHLPRDQPVVFWAPELSRVAGEDRYRWASYHLFDVELRFWWQGELPESTTHLLVYGVADPGEDWESVYEHQRGRLWKRL